jgi:iron complex outermembrane recepter protein
MRRVSYLSRCLFLGVSALGLTVSTSASAQDSADENAESDNGEIIVTATRVGESIQKVPVAVNVVGAEQLDELRVQSVGDVLAFTPGAQSFGSDPAAQAVYIRGVGSDIFGASADAAVVTIVDSAVLSRTWMRPGAVFDLNRVEVARGPQGTTFGRNATAGVIQFISNRPVFEDSGDLSFDVGNYNAFEVSGAFNKKLSENVALRLAGFARTQDGYFSDERNPDKTYGDRSTIALRGQLLFKAGENLDILLRGAYSDEHIDEATLGEITDPTRPVSYPPFPGFGNFQPLDLDPRTVQTSDGQYWDRELWNIGHETVLRVNDLTFTWTADFAKGKLPSYIHPWGVPFLAFKQVSDERAEVFQTEFRVDNSASDSPIQAVAGLFYLTEDVFRQEEKQIMVGSPLQTYHDFRQLNKTKSFGAFLNAQYELATGTTIAAGVRYSYDKKDYEVPFSTCSKLPNPLGLNPVPGGRGSAICRAFIRAADWNTGTDFVSGAREQSWDNISFRVSVNQEIGSNVNLYASYATAYKGGGFPNEPESSSPDAFTPYDPEKVKTIEVGVKGALFDRAVRFEIAAFDSKYDDRQAEQILLPLGVNVVANIASASIKGIEGQLSWNVTDRFTISGNASILDHKDDTTGAKLAAIMDWTAFLSASYTMPLADGSKIRLYGDVRDRSSRLTADTPPLVIPGETLFGGSISWTSADEDLSVTIWGRNLTNELDIQQLSARTVLGNQGTRTAGAPRTFGATLRTKF